MFVDRFIIATEQHIRSHTKDISSNMGTLWNFQAPTQKDNRTFVYWLFLGYHPVNIDSFQTEEEKKEKEQKKKTNRFQSLLLIRVRNLVKLVLAAKCLDDTCQFKAHSQN